MTINDREHEEISRIIFELEKLLDYKELPSIKCIRNIVRGTDLLNFSDAQIKSVINDIAETRGGKQ